MTGADLFAQLTPAQRDAVAHIDGPLLILAGPGSGKTRVVTHRIANLLQHGIPPREILALTFTNKAADEMRQRVEQLTGQRGVWLGTFHAFCARLLRQYAELAGLQPNYSICDTDDSHRVLKQARRRDPGDADPHLAGRRRQRDQLGQEQPDHGRRIPAAPQQYDRGDRRRKSIPATSSCCWRPMPPTSTICCCTWPDCCGRTPNCGLRWTSGIATSWSTSTRTRTWPSTPSCGPCPIDHPNLAVTGDPDQSIYGWRGANLSNILEFEKDFPNVKVVRLEQNFRSTPNILRAADQLIANNMRRKPKRLYTDRPEGAPVRLVDFATGQDEAAGIAGRIAQWLRDGQRNARDFAVFYRVNALSRQLEHAFRSLGVPYQIVSGLEFYQRREIKDVLAYLQLLHNPRNNVAFARIVNVPPRGIGRTTLARLGQHAAQSGLSLLDAARQARQIETLSKRAAADLTRFVGLFDGIARAVSGPLRDLLGAVLAESGYRQWLQDSEAAEDQERLANIEELLTAADEFDVQYPVEDNRLEIFLEQTALVADTDAWEERSDRVTLMTLHAAKGLEFPAVFVVAVEEGLLPHERSQDAPDQLEEERRLLFVGLTRAREELQLSYAQYRAFRGERRPTVPSQFLMELPRQEMSITEAPPSWSTTIRCTTMGRTTTTCTTSLRTTTTSRPTRSGGGAGGRPRRPCGRTTSSCRRHPRSSSRPRRAQPLRTAAELLEEQAAEPGRIPLGRFCCGMEVFHPDYGAGAILTVSGSGVKRTATVRFAQTGEVKTFRLLYSPLRPLETEST